MAEDSPILSAVPREAAPAPEAERGGITWASVLLGAAFFILLAWNLPFWSLAKNYTLGMGGYLPMEALVLTLLLLLFNRFGASLALVVGLVAVAVFIPSWHEAVYIKSPDAARSLSGLSRALYQACAGPIESARETGGLPDLLVLTGAVAAFLVGGVLGWLGAVVLPALRRRLAWREILVVFVLISVGTFSCHAVEWLVGVVTVPYKDDAPERDFKRRFVRPVPIEQDPENRGGIPTKLVPYDPSKYDMVRAVTRPREGGPASNISAEEQATIDLFRRNIDAALPEPEAVEELLASAAAADAWLGDRGKSSARAGKLGDDIGKYRDQFMKPGSLAAFAQARSALRAAVGEVEAEKARLDQAAGSNVAPLVANAHREGLRGKGRAVVFGLMTAAAAEETAALERFRKGIRKSLPETARVEQLLAESDALAAWLNGAGRGAEISGRLLGALDKARAALQQAGDAKSTAEALKAFETAMAEVQSKRTSVDKVAGRKSEPFREDTAKPLPEAEKVKQLLAAGDRASAWLRDPSRGQEITGQLLGALDKARGSLLQASDVKTAAGALKTFEAAVDQVQSEKAAIDKAAGRKPEPVKADAQQDAARRGDGRALAEKIRDAERATFMSRWTRPLVWWMSLLGLVLLAQVFLAVLLRRQWAEHEKLMFPHAEVVRALAEGGGFGEQSRRVFASPLFWIGAGLSGGIFLLQGLNWLFPSVAAPNLHSLSLATFISERPWKAMNPAVEIQPSLVSISYLVTAELSMSVWVFGIFNQALRVGASAYGVPRDNAWAIHGEVANSDSLYTGAILIFVAWLAWSGRRHIWHVVRRGLGMVAPDAGERSEPMSYPVAFWGFWLSTAGIMAWCLLVGLKLWVMAVLFGLYLVLVVLFSRLVAEVGLLTTGAGWLPFYPQFTFAWIFGLGQGAAGKMIAYKDGWLGAGGTLIPVTLAPVSVWSFIWPSMVQTLQVTPFMLAGFKLTEGEPRRKRLLTWLMIAALLAGMGIFLMGTLDFAFERGSEATGFLGFKCPSWTFNNWLIRDLVNKERMWTHDPLRLILMSIGGAVMTALLVCRSMFYWWPLHPVGMVASGIDGIWVSFLIGWIIKRLALAYGGGEFSQRVNAFFYGLIVGQFVMAAFWNVIGLCGTGCPGAGGLLPSAG